MSLINSELTVAAQKSLDGKMYKVVSNKSVPYDSIADVLATITSTRRHIGQKFRYIDGSGISDCHFVGDITDGSLVKIVTGGGALLQTNSVDNNDQGLLNLIDSDTVMAEYISPGKVTFHASGGGGTPLITVTKASADALIAAGTLIPGQNYLITGVDVGLYGGTDIILKAASTNLFEISGSGFFYNPKYTEDPGWGIWTNFMESPTAFSSVVGTFDYTYKELVTAQNGATANVLADGFLEWVSGDWSAATSITGGTSGATATISGFTSPSYAIGDTVIWGGKHWTNVAGNIGSADDDFNLDSEWTAVAFDTTNYNLVSDIIEYDYDNDRILFRSDNIGNEVKTI